MKNMLEELVEDAAWDGVPASAEESSTPLYSIAISLKRIADTLEEIRNNHLPPT